MSWRHASAFKRIIHGSGRGIVESGKSRDVAEAELHHRGFVLRDIEGREERA